ncbi:MAG: VWA domain-containing protein [Pyrinomonadaceae bacterium]
MFFSTIPTRTLLLSLYLLVSGSLLPSFGQQQVETLQTKEPDDVLRINTNLMQVQAVILDKQGRFVDNLKPDQFEVTVGGKPVAVSFLELVNAGSPNEEAQLATARGTPLPSGKNRRGRAEGRGRTIFFFVDDLHLTPESLVRTRQTLLRSIEDEVKPGDQVALVSPSGQIGFLQQLTDNKAVLRAALTRLRVARSVAVRDDSEQALMSPYQAQAIERNNPDMLAYFIAELRKRFRESLSAEAAEMMVRGRARRIAQQANAVTTNTLSTLSNLVRSAAPLPGRKLVFFLSDGFRIDDSPDELNWLRLITDGAARSNVVIYTVHTRGLTSGLVDVTTPQDFDRTNRLTSPIGELHATQEPLHTLAADTGGRALMNTNAFGEAIDKVLQETSRYYLLAWQMGQIEQRDAKYQRINIALRDRPDLKVLTHGGFFAAPPQPSSGKRPGTEKEAAEAVPTDAGLLSALNSRYPIKSLPTSVSAGYMDSPQGDIVLISTMELDAEALDLGTDGEGRNAEVDIMGVVFDDRGKIVSNFKELLTVPPPAVTRKTERRQRLGYNHQCRLAPGLYLVKVASQERRSGRKGNAAQWVEIPDLRQGQFALGSLFIEEQLAGDPTVVSSGMSSPAQALPVAGGRLAQTSTLRLRTIIYNAQGNASAPPDVVVQVQFLRDNRPVLSTPLGKVGVEGVEDLKRVPYGASVPLKTFPAGQYTLHVLAIDRVAKASSSQQITFVVETVK